MKAFGFFLMTLFGAVVSQTKDFENQSKSLNSKNQLNTTRIVYPSEDTNKNRRPTHVSNEVHESIISHYKKKVHLLSSELVFVEQYRLTLRLWKNPVANNISIKKLKKEL